MTVGAATKLPQGTVRQETVPFWQSQTRVQRLKIVCVTAFLTLLLAPTLLPYYWTVSTSLKSLDQIYAWPPAWFPDPVVFDAFEAAFETFPFWWAFRNTATVMIPRLIGGLLSASICAFSFARLRWPGRDKWFLVLLGTMMIPWQVTLIPRYIVFVTTWRMPRASTDATAITCSGSLGFPTSRPH